MKQIPVLTIFFLSNWLILLASLRDKAILYKSRLPSWFSIIALRLVGDDMSDRFCLSCSSLCVTFCFSVSKNSFNLEPLVEAGLNWACEINKDIIVYHRKDMQLLKTHYIYFVYFSSLFLYLCIFHSSIFRHSNY